MTGGAYIEGFPFGLSVGCIVISAFFVVVISCHVFLRFGYYGHDSRMKWSFLITYREFLTRSGAAEDHESVARLKL